MSSGQRIKIIRESLKLSRVAFAKPLEITGQYISMLEAGDKNPSQTLISLLLKEYRVRKEWWETGEGKIFEPAESVKEPQAPYTTQGSVYFETLKDVIPKLSEEKQQLLLKKALDMLVGGNTGEE